MYPYGNSVHQRVNVVSVIFCCINISSKAATTTDAQTLTEIITACQSLSPFSYTLTYCSVYHNTSHLEHIPTCHILPDHSPIYRLLQVGGQHVWAMTGKLQSMLTWSSDALSRCPLTLGFHDKPYLHRQTVTHSSHLSWVHLTADYPALTWVSRFLMTHQATQFHSRWFTLENTGQKTN